MKGMVQIVIEYIVNRDNADLIKFMKTKADKIGLQCKFEDNKFIVEAKPGTDKYTQTPIPVVFQGKLSEESGQSKIVGKFTYGFYLTTLVIIAVILIVARLTWSIYQKQMDNIILCGIVTVLLIVVCVVVRIKGKELKTKIEEFLRDLDKR